MSRSPLTYSRALLVVAFALLSGTAVHAKGTSTQGTTAAITTAVHGVDWAQNVQQVHHRGVPRGKRFTSGRLARRGGYYYAPRYAYRPYAYHPYSRFYRAHRYGRRSRLFRY